MENFFLIIIACLVILFIAVIIVTIKILNKFNVLQDSLNQSVLNNKESFTLAINEILKVFEASKRLNQDASMEIKDLINTSSQSLKLSIDNSNTQNYTNLTNQLEHLDENIIKNIHQVQESLKSSINDLLGSNNKSILDEIGGLSNSVDLIQNLNVDLAQSTNEHIKKSLDKHNEKITLFMAENIEKSNTDITGQLKRLSTNMTTGISEIKEDYLRYLNYMKKLQEYNKKELAENFKSMIKLFPILRIDNLVDLNNEIAKYRNGVIEDDYFLQEVGHCKVTKLIDKQTNEITEVTYDNNGLKNNTQTFLDGKIKYEMSYMDGLLHEGKEYNDEQQVAFHYQYNEAGEVSKKTEYTYDENGEIKNKKEINY